MNYKLNKILNQTSKSNADLFHIQVKGIALGCSEMYFTNSWRHKLYIYTLQFPPTPMAMKILEEPFQMFMKIIEYIRM